LARRRRTLIAGVRGNRDQQDSPVRLLTLGDRRDARDVVDGIVDDLSVWRWHGLESALVVAGLHL
jgi:hypothetical protein